MAITIEIRGLPGLQAMLDKAGRGAWIEQGLAEAALELERRAKMKAQFTQGYQTGRTRASIAARKFSNLTHGVQVGTEYAAFVELGTGQRGRASPQPGGIPSGYRHGSKPGMRAQPFLRPAALEVLALMERPDFWPDPFE